ncbi:MAG: rod shape-determining protein MreC [Erysipelotrichales bacterium]
MYNNNKKMNKHNKRIIIITVIIVVFSIVTLVTSRSVTGVETMFKDTIANIEYYLIKAPIQYVNSLFSEYNELKDVYEENAKLKEKLGNYTREAALNETLSKELQDLKDLTKIDYLPTDYNVNYTKVIARDAESWNNEVTIDLGKMAGVKEGMAVISSQGMIGTITSSNEISATVSLLSNENSKSQLPVMILSGDNEYYGLLNKYDLETKSYRITLLSDAEKIEEGARVVTSGLGGIGKSPKGILVGTVNNYTAGNDSYESVCMVKPSADFDSLNYVAVVQRVNE